MKLRCLYGGLNCVPQIHDKVLISQEATVFRRRAFKNLIKVSFSFIYSMCISLNVSKIDYVYESVFTAEDGC